MKPYWKGVFPAATTQFKKDQSLDLDATAKHLEVLLDSGVSGLIMCGSPGENQAMEPEEKRLVVRAAVEVSRGRIPVLSGVAETSTAAAIRYVRDVARLGASGVMLMPERTMSTLPSVRAGRRSGKGIEVSERSTPIASARSRARSTSSPINLPS